MFHSHRPHRVKNTVAYYGTECITGWKGFIVNAGDKRAREEIKWQTNIR